MRKALILILLSSFAYAGGPLYGHKDRFVDQEFVNVYQDIGNVLKGPLTISSMTVSSFTISGSYSGVALGKIKQVVGMNSNSATSTTSLTFVATNLSLAITPTSTTSKILIMASGTTRTANAANGGIILTIARGGTNLGDTKGFMNIFDSASTNALDIPFAVVHLDSPSTTSATTYDIRIRTDNTSHAAQLLNQSNKGSLILAEVEP